MAEVSAMVDTGAAHTMMPESLLQQLHVEPRAQRHFLLADGSGASYGYGIARIALAGQEWPCPVSFGPEEQYLLGATTLEIFDLTVDPLGQKLIPAVHRARPI